MTWHDMAMGNEALLDDIPNQYIVIYLVFSLILTIAYHSYIKLNCKRVDVKRSLAWSKGNLQETKKQFASQRKVLL